MIAVGVDVGSVATKVVIVRDMKAVLAREIAPTGPECSRTATELFHRALETAEIRAEDVDAVGSTGYGRRRVNLDKRVMTEISACAKGLEWQLGELRTPHLAIDLGGQDTKIILLRADGGVEDFTMNDKCAAGTGRFLEVMAGSLQVGLDQFGELSAKARTPVRINSTCAVFAESEVISLLAEGKTVEDIVAGLHASIAERIAAMSFNLGRSDTVLFCGGGAKNEGMRSALAEKLEAKVIVPEAPQFINATGAALFASDSTYPPTP